MLWSIVSIIIIIIISALINLTINITAKFGTIYKAENYNYLTYWFMKALYNNNNEIKISTATLI